ncbi:Beta-1,4-galactosyltransferase 2 [Dissostichus eleginoides]|nr:Beta-1,4-galactosyltransferase 2 [Dissostichus eleginoides]
MSDILQQKEYSESVGRLLIEFGSQMTMERVQKENPNVTEGGRYTPPDCRPRWKVAIIIPFRHRENHLKYWLHYLHPILRRQKIDYGIYIINQTFGSACPTVLHS